MQAIPPPDWWDSNAEHQQFIYICGVLIGVRLISLSPKFSFIRKLLYISGLARAAGLDSVLRGVRTNLLPLSA